MKKIILPFLLITALLLGSCTKEDIEIEDNDNVVTKEEKTEIKEVAGETEEEQDQYVEEMDEVSDDDSLDTLEKELDDTVILEEDFLDL